MKNAEVTYQQDGKAVGKSDGFLGKEYLRTVFRKGKVRMIITWIKKRVGKPHGNRSSGGWEKNRRTRRRSKTITLFRGIG